MSFTHHKTIFANKSFLEHGIKSLGFILRSDQLFSLLEKVNGDLLTTHDVVLRHVLK